MGSATWQASHLSCRQTSGDVPENKILPLFTPYWLRCYIMYPPWNQHSTWKWMLGRLVSFLEGLFSGAMLLVARVVDFQITAIKGTMWVHFGEYPRGVVLYNCYNSASGKFRLTSPPKRVLVIANMQGKLGLPVSSLMTHTPLSAYRIQICNMTVNLQEMYNTTRCKWCIYIYTCIRYIGYIALLHLHIHHATSIRSTKIQHHRNIISG